MDGDKRKTPFVPDLTLAQIIMVAVAKYTGREVVGAQVYALEGDYLQVTVSLGEDGRLSVDLADPLQPCPADAEAV